MKVLIYGHKGWIGNQVLDLLSDHEVILGKVRVNNKKDLEQGLIKSSHLPFITTRNCYREFDNINYLDGGTPYVFRDIGETNGKKYNAS